MPRSLDQVCHTAERAEGSLLNRAPNMVKAAMLLPGDNTNIYRSWHSDERDEPAEVSRILQKMRLQVWQHRES